MLMPLSLIVDGLLQIITHAIVETQAYIYQLVATPWLLTTQARKTSDVSFA
jgi:hypothetical protein